MKRGIANRRAVTIRLNVQEQENLRNLMLFWKRDEKDILKFAFEQLVVSTTQIAKKIEQEEKENENSQTKSAGSSDVSSGSDIADSNSSPEADAAVNAS